MTQTDTNNSKDNHFFDLPASRLAFEKGISFVAAGDDKAAIVSLQEAINLFPIRTEYYRAMADSSDRVGDAESSRLARFVASRLEINLPSGLNFTAIVFGQAAVTEPIDGVNKLKYKKTVNRISALLEALVCIEKEKERQTAKDKQSLFQKYGVDYWIQLISFWKETSSDACPKVIL